MRVHFIAVGGSIMHHLAITLARKGYVISGSDDYIYEPSRTHLAENGLLPATLGWFPDKLDNDIDAVVVGMHATEDNPELLRAKQLGLHIYSYPEFIYEQAADKVRVVVGGSYGKTTITSMIMHVLKVRGRLFDYLVGAELDGFDGMVSMTKEAPIMIIEGDENLASPTDRRPKFLLYRPNIALISGIGWEHMQVFPTREEYVRQFKLFIECIEPKGTLVYNKEDKSLQELVSADHSPINKHGYRMPEYMINKGITYIRTSAGDIPLRVFGKHNLSNVAAAQTLCEWIGVSRADFYAAIQSFKGASRRLEYVADSNGSVVYKDFADTPFKLKQAIHAVKEQYPTSQLVTILKIQAQDSLDEGYLRQFHGSLEEADVPVVFINLEAFKQKNFIPVSESKMKEIFGNHRLIYITAVEGLQQFLKERDCRGSNLLFVGEGDWGGVNFSGLADFFLKC